MISSYSLNGSKNPNSIAYYPCLGILAFSRSFSLIVNLSSDSFAGLPTSEPAETKDCAESTEVGWDCSDCALVLEEAEPRD